MAVAVTDLGRAFLRTVRERYLRARPTEPEYDAIVYRARFLPDPEVLHLIVQMSGRRGATRPDVPGSPAVRERAAAILRPMQWPDPRPLATLAPLFPGWTSLHLSTLMHAVIPDYPIWGEEESRALARLGHALPYRPDPRGAVDAYGAYIAVVKALRDAAHHDEVPESHHFLTRIVQAALLDLAREAAS